MKLEACTYARIFSDLHLDFDVRHIKVPSILDAWAPTPLSTDKDTLLIIAGDIWHAGKMLSFAGESWMKLMADRFKQVVFALGNHDLWNGNVTTGYAKVRAQIAEQNLTNVHLLQNDVIEIGDYKLVGGTLWTDFLKQNPSCMITAPQFMNDYAYIKHGDGYCKLRPQHILDEHLKTRSFIRDNGKPDYDGQKVWVISHHLPSYLCVADQYRRPQDELINGLFYSDLDKLIDEIQPQRWIYGHTHTNGDQLLGSTTLFANPRGYPGENSEFDEISLFTME